MKKKEHRGRPSLIPPKIIKQYTQVFQNDDGSVSTWIWDKDKYNKGPLSVEVEYPNSAIINKLEKEKYNIEVKYRAEEGQRKPRILKVDKLRLEELEQLINNEYQKQ